MAEFLDKNGLILYTNILKEKLSEKASIDYVDNKVTKLITNTALKFYCVEPVTVIINGESTVFNTNSMVEMFLKTTDEFEVVPTSNSSISQLNSWVGPLNTFYPWLEGVQTFSNILFDMNSEEMYTKWNQNNQGDYHVQKAQYVNCVFWSDNPYINDIAVRTNYTLYYSAQLPLCYSTIPDNTYKPFYLAYGVKTDPNWNNPLYIQSFSKVTYATQTFSYYGMSNISIYNMAIDAIVLPKDCRGLMFSSPSIERAGVFDAANTTNFGAKSGSWRDAFGGCDSLKTLYIMNLKTSINVSWSPLEIDSIEYIVENAANTSNITLYVSPYTWYRLNDTVKATATSKNITISLLEGNMREDSRLGGSIEPEYINNLFN